MRWVTKGRVLALAPLGLLAAAMALRVHALGGVLTTDTLQLLHGTAATDACLHAGSLRCHDVGQWPLLQYLPALAVKRLGGSRSQAANALIYLNFASVLGTLALLWVAGARSRLPGGAQLAAVAGLVSPLLWYGVAGFGEATAAFAGTLFVVGVALRWHPALIAVALFAAGISKETALPFLLVFGLLALRAGHHTGRSRRTVAAAILAGAFAALAATVLFNLFRYGVPYNRYYADPDWMVSSLGDRARIVIAYLIAPNTGLLLFWPVACLVGGVAIAAGGRGRRTVALATLTLLALVVVFASWWSPFGWFAWGARFIVPWVPPFLALTLLAASAGAGEAMRRLLRSRALVLGTGAVALVLGLAQLGAFLGFVHVLDRFYAPPAAGACARFPRQNGLALIRAGDPAVHASSADCVVESAWGGGFVLRDAYREFRGARWIYAALYAAALAGLLTAASSRARGYGKTVAPVVASMIVIALTGQLAAASTRSSRAAPFGSITTAFSSSSSSKTPGAELTQSPNP
jgi:hypothetical protein